MQLKAMAAISALPFLAGCAVNPFNLSSLPMPSSIDVRNEQTQEWLATSGPSGAESLGLEVPLRDPLADGEVVGLTISGGGMRASAFALGVLEELEAVKLSGTTSNALERVDFISSISGGSWAVAGVLTQMVDKPGEPLAIGSKAITKRFADTRNYKVRNWADGVIAEITQGMTFKDIYGSPMGSQLPLVFFGASLYPSQSPFVFTSAYLEHYRVRELGDYGMPSRVELDGYSIAKVPIGYAASASGTVPGFTSAFASTDLCADGVFTFCAAKPKKRSDYIQIVDGGVYDNLGYKTAFEYLLALRSTAGGVLPSSTIIMIDSGTDEPDHTIPRKKRNSSNALGYAFASSFPNQDATFARLARAQFTAVGLKPHQVVLIDFDSLAGFDAERHQADLQDLPDLAHFAANGVSCTRKDGSLFKAPNKLSEPDKPSSVEASLDALSQKGPDCAGMNFLRAGYLHKTTYKYDQYAFKLRYQLGKLAVRMNGEKLEKALMR